MPGPCLFQPSPSANFPSSYFILSESSEPPGKPPKVSRPLRSFLIKNSKDTHHTSVPVTIESVTCLVKDSRGVQA